MRLHQVPEDIYASELRKPSVKIPADTRKAMHRGSRKWFPDPLKIAHQEHANQTRNPVALKQSVVAARRCQRPWAPPCPGGNWPPAPLPRRRDKGDGQPGRWIYLVIELVKHAAVILRDVRLVAPDGGRPPAALVRASVRRRPFTPWSGNYQASLFMVAQKVQATGGRDHGRVVTIQLHRSSSPS